MPVDAVSRRIRALPVHLAFFTIFATFMAVNVVRKDIYTQSAELYWFIDLLKFVVIPAGTLILLAQRSGVNPSEYGLGSARASSIAGLTILAAILLEMAYQVGLAFGWIVFRGSQQPEAFYLNIMPAGSLRVAVAFYFAATAGIVEEIAFRGLPLLYFQRAFAKIPKGLYILVSSTCFSLIHWTNGPPEVVATWVFGVAAAILYLKVRTLWPLIGGHVLIDAYHFGWP